MNLENYTTYDMPVPYKNLNLYPICVVDYVRFNIYSSCFLLEKNYIKDIKIISMTELEYIYSLAEQDTEANPYLIFFDRLLSLCLKEDESFENIEKSITRYKYDEKNKPYFEIGGERYTSKDFDTIRDIVCEQNMVELPDYSIQKEVRDSLEEAQRYKNRVSGVKPASFEDYIISLATVTGWTMDYIHSLTIRKFIKSVQRLDNLIHYKIYLTASMSGLVEFKDKSFIKHWLTSIEDKDRYSDVSLDYDALKSKISLESAKK